MTYLLLLSLVAGYNFTVQISQPHIIFILADDMVGNTVIILQYSVTIIVFMLHYFVTFVVNINERSKNYLHFNYI